jgi:Kef-type K+ transport system membrane component KefB
VEVFLQLLVILLLTRAFGEGAERLGQSASVGELIAGVCLAAVVGQLGERVPVLGDLATSEPVEWVAKLGIFFLVLLAGIEMKPREIARSSAGALAIALGGMVLPLAGGIGLGILFLPESELKPVLALVIGVSMAITAIPATVKVFSDFGLLHSRVGELVVSAAVFDDVLSLFLLAAVTTLIETGQVPDLTVLAFLLAKVVAFFAVTVALGVHLYPRISRGIREMEAAALELSAMVALGLGYGWLAEALGMHWVIGAFMAGLYFEESRVGKLAYEDLRLIVTALTSGLLGPIFFAWIGLQLDLATVTAVPSFLLSLIAVAFAGKLIGAGLPALWIGLPRREALAVGVGMSARGAMELVILSIVLEAGLFAMADSQNPVETHLFSALVIMAIVNTLLSPIALRRIFRAGQPPARPEE